MAKKKEKIYISDNPTEAQIVESNVMTAFERLTMVEKILSEKDIPITLDIIKACLTMRRETRTREVESKTQFDRGGKAIPMLESYEVWAYCDALDEAIEKELKIVDEYSAPILAESHKNELRKEYETMKEAIYGCFHINLLNIDTSSLLKYIIVEDGHCILPEDISERILHDTAIYATTDVGIEARLLHEEITKKLNKLVEMMKNVDRLFLVSKIDKLFVVTDDYKFIPSAIDYDLFCK